MLLSIILLVGAGRALPAGCVSGRPLLPGLFPGGVLPFGRPFDPLFPGVLFPWVLTGLPLLPLFPDALPGRPLLPLFPDALPGRPLYPLFPWVLPGRPLFW
jgi:hypothetical protein